jgi:DNA-binding NarL/FixJ family response regulator
MRIQIIRKGGGNLINIIIADDQVLLRRSLSHLISSDPEINVYCTVASGKEAIENCDLYKPDIILMDIEMPEMDGISALKIIKEKYKDTKVIILTTFENTENIVDAFLAEADGYITKDIDCDELIATIKCVNYGLTVIHKSVKKIMVDKFTRVSEGKKNYQNLLTSEEIEIVRGIVNGKSNKELSGILNYTEGTIKNKVSKIYDKLNISDRLQLAVFAVENGID